MRQETKEGQELVIDCRRLIQKAIILWNYLYLSKLITNCESEEKKQDIHDIIKSGSIITWHHINLHGEFDFSEQQTASTFDMEAILNLYKR